MPFVPLALLDLVPGFIIWTLFSLGCLGLAIWLLLKDVDGAERTTARLRDAGAEVPELKPRWRGLLVLVFAFAPVFFGLIDGRTRPSRCCCTCSSTAPC